MRLLTFLKNIFALPRVWKGTRLIEQSINMLAMDKAKEAELLFEKGEVYWGELPIYYKIIKGDIKFRLRKREECIVIFLDAWSGVEHSQTISKIDKIYLQEHIYSALKIFEQYLEADLKHITPVHLPDIPLQDVSTLWKKRFPARDHPDWSRYGT